MSEPERRALVTSARWTAGIYALILVAGLVGIREFARSGNIIMLVLDVVGVALFAVLAVRAARSGIYADGEDLLARHEFGTTRVPWRDIERFERRGTKGLGAGGATANGSFSSTSRRSRRSAPLAPSNVSCWGVRGLSGRPSSCARRSRPS